MWVRASGLLELLPSGNIFLADGGVAGEGRHITIPFKYFIAKKDLTKKFLTAGCLSFGGESSPLLLV